GPAGIVSLGLTSVRGAWLGFGAGCLACAFGLRRRWLVLGAVVLVLAASLIAEPRLLDRVKTVPDLTNDTARDRLAMLSAGLGLPLAPPVTRVRPRPGQTRCPLVAP